MGTKLDVEGCQLLPEELWILDVSEVVAPPDQEEDLHVEDYEENDIGQGGQDKEEISTFRPHDVLYMVHCLREVFNVAERQR